MPSPNALLQAFELTKGHKVSSYTLAQASSTHDVLREFQRYSYHIKLRFGATNKHKTLSIGDKEAFIISLRKLLGKPKVVFSQYGNPYECIFVDELDSLQVKTTKDYTVIWVELVAFANRISKSVSKH